MRRSQRGFRQIDNLRARTFDFARQALVEIAPLVLIEGLLFKTALQCSGYLILF